VAHGVALADRLRARIGRDGPMTFRDWMEACLYDPDEGFYMRHPRGPRTGPGADADFATSPTLHPFFARCVAEEAIDVWVRLGKPARLDVVESGGGLGDLARDALGWLDAMAEGRARHSADATPPAAGTLQARNAAALAAGIRWHHVEASPTHRAAQAGDGRVSSGESMPRTAAGLVVANEFLDALPFHWLEWRGAWREVHVGLDGGRFVERLLPATPAALAAAPAGPFADGQRVAASPAAMRWLATVGERLGRGRALVVDYGERADRLWTAGRADGTVRGFRRHQHADVLDVPGETDITASVDFTATRRWGEAAGLREVGYESQEAFLLRHGVLEALNATDRTTRAGASDYLRLRQLLLPTGLGAAFKVQTFEK
jgi:SAM-dependent MidA family methyltransferase